MFLKRVQVRGFKSFADRTVLDLDRGLIAIVGPNGTGKSNLVEAIRWALGEQSPRSLRTGRMENVIFAGTASRKPVSLAEVTVVLDNSDGSLPIEFSEVSITRRVDRTGFSEYLVNGTPCLLRQLQVLLAGTGLGRDSCALVGQGRLEEPIACGPEGRRLLLEEACGLSRYKLQRKEAARNLDEASACMDRLGAAAKEIERRIWPLEEEISRLRSYEAISSEAEKMERNLAAWEYASVRRELLDRKRALEKITRHSEAVQEELRALECSSGGLKSDVERLASVLGEERLRRASASAEVVSAKTRAGFLRREADRLRDELFRTSAEGRERAERLRAASREAIGLLREQDALEREKIEAGSAWEHLVEESALCRALAETAKAGAERDLRLYEAWSRALVKLSAIRGQLLRSAEEALAKEREWEQAARSLARLVGSAKEEAQRAESARRMTAERVVLLESELEKALHGISQASREAERFAARREELAAEARRIGSVLEVLEESYSRHEGYHRSVRDFMEASSRDPRLWEGIEGVVGDLVSCSPGYEDAIEAALGAAAGHVVVRDESCAVKAIAFLKKARLGRITFLPLATIRGNRGNPEWLKAKGVLGFASDFADSSPEHRGVVMSLLGRVIVASDVRSAIEAARSLRFAVKVVSLEGEVVWPGGAITGGSAGRGRRLHLVGRARRIGSLREELGRVRSQEKEAELGLESKAAEKSCLERERTRIASELSEQRARLEDASLACARSRDELMKRRHELKAIGLGRKELLATRRQTAEKIKRLEGAMSKLSFFRDGSGRVRSEAMSRIKELEDEAGALSRSADAVLSRVEDLRRRAAFGAEAIGRAEASMEALAAEAAALEERRVRLLIGSDSVAADLAECERELKEARERLGQVEARIAEVEKGLEERRHEIDRAERRSEDLRAESAEAQRRGRDLAIEVAELAGASKEMLSRMTSDAIRELAGDDFPVPGEREIREAMNRKEELEEALLKLGPVNFRAREDASALRARVAALNEDIGDVRDAVLITRGMIEELDRKANQAFVDGFSAASRGFEEAFRDLFGGGEAGLELVRHGDDPAEWGIDLRVGLPGRKAKGLYALSGGERALVALAFTFGLLGLGQAPFVVLDEVESSLDEANVQRFAGFLRTRAASTQFLVVTHNRITMESCDVLYGVTMEEPGISKVVSIRLDEVNDWKERR